MQALIFKIKKFRDYSEKCLAGEDKEFIANFMAKKGTTIFEPAEIKDLFTAEMLYEDNVL